MWRTTPVHRWELLGSPSEDAPPALTEIAESTDLQRPDDGVGALFHRVYRTSIRDSPHRAHELMALVTADVDAIAPSELARFEKIRGEPGMLRVGDEYVVRMPGPWDGPVRVVDVTAHSFRLATLDGHLEAGQIEFRAHQSPESIEFVIESWARSANRLSNVLYARLRMAKEVQLHMWTSVLQRVVALAAGRMDGGIRVITRRVDADGTLMASRRGSHRRLAELRGRQANFDRSRSGEHTRDAGWHVDNMRVLLPGEPPGEPIKDGAWMAARRLMHDYQMADPARIRAVFDRDAPLDGRDMLLEIRFLILRFRVGVRVGTPYDETRLVGHRPVRVFGWSYRTLEGHFEMGEMHYQVWKWLDDGAVEFRIHAYSRPAASGPIWLRLGFRLVGRRQQLAFYGSTCRRMRRLTESQAELADVRDRAAHA